MKRKYYCTSHVAGFQYEEGLLCYDKLNVGTELKMVRENDNPHDPNAIALYYKEFKIGYIPKADNTQFAILMDCGWTDLFEVYINRKDPDAHPEEQLGITIFVKEKDRNQKK